AYKLVLKWSLIRLKIESASRKSHTLLLLRVFGFDRRTQQLLDDLGQRWRTIGPIQLIGGTDLVSTTIEPHEAFEFLNGRLSRSFIKNREDVEHRLSQRSIIPDPDGLFRIDDFYCYDYNWQMTVSVLAPAAGAVLMDLRSFTADNRGCIAEIKQLIATVPIERVVLLTDLSTDMVVLEQTLRIAFNAVPGDSTNNSIKNSRLRILRASHRQKRSLDSLLGLLCDNFATGSVT
ncbi:MAG: hypothetical protein GY792_36395, partial [Gammaproteobacteria bacterium]|nr:hypothetical protein [Gammaproteobacteria bacterium]